MPDSYRELCTLSLQNVKVCCQKSSGLGKSGTVISWYSLAIIYQSPHFRRSRNVLSILISPLEAGKGNILQQPAQMPLQCSWTGIVLEFAFGIETVAASLSKIWRGFGKSRSIPHWSMLLVWCCVNFNKIVILKCTQNCSILTLFTQLNSGAKIAKIRKDVCGRSAVLQH